jgi:hypothetical protein
LALEAQLDDCSVFWHLGGPNHAVSNQTMSRKYHQTTFVRSPHRSFDDVFLLWLANIALDPSVGGLVCFTGVRTATIRCTVSTQKCYRKKFTRKIPITLSFGNYKFNACFHSRVLARRIDFGDLAQHGYMWTVSIFYCVSKTSIDLIRFESMTGNSLAVNAQKFSSLAFSYLDSFKGDNELTKTQREQVVR